MSEVYCIINLKLKTDLPQVADEEGRGAEVDEDAGDVVGGLNDVTRDAKKLKIVSREPEA